MSIALELSAGQKRFSFSVAMIAALIPALILFAAPNSHWVSFGPEDATSQLFKTVFQTMQKYSPSRISANPAMSGQNSTPLAPTVALLGVAGGEDIMSGFDQLNGCVYIRVFLALTASVVATTIFTLSMRFAKLFQDKTVEIHSSSSSSSSSSSVVSVALMVTDFVLIIAAILQRFPIFVQQLGFEEFPPVSSGLTLGVWMTTVVNAFHLCLTRRRVQDYLDSVMDHVSEDRLKTIICSNTGDDANRIELRDTEFIQAKIHYRLCLTTTSSYVCTIGAFYILPALFILICTMMHMMFATVSSSSDALRLGNLTFMSSIFGSLAFCSDCSWALATVYGLVRERFKTFLGVRVRRGTKQVRK